MVDANPRCSPGEGRAPSEARRECYPQRLQGTREWRNRQTRTVQVRVPERAWGFNSPLAHWFRGTYPGREGPFVVQVGESRPETRTVPFNIWA